MKPNLFKTIKPMIKPNEIGGILGWNTFKKGSYPKKKDKFKGSVTSNPVTWDTTKLQSYINIKVFCIQIKKYTKEL